MKFKNNKSTIIAPFLVGAIALALGVGQLLYYIISENAKKTMASYLFSALIILIGIAILCFAVYMVFLQKKKKAAMEIGEDCIATFERFETNTTSNKVNYYSITYTFSSKDFSFKRTSKEEFTWKEVLTLKALKHFRIKFYKNMVVLADDLESLFYQNKDLVLLEEQKYNEAYNKVENYLNSKNNNK